MSDTVVVALIGLAGSGFGSFVGIAVNSKMMSYRLEQLEKQFAELVNKQSAFDARLAALESKNAIQDERIMQLGHRVEELAQETGRN